jgi:hypothetical protein
VDDGAEFDLQQVFLSKSLARLFRDLANHHPGAAILPGSGILSMLSAGRHLNIILAEQGSLP